MDWQTLVKDLTNRSQGGMSQQALASLLLCGQSTISDLACGTTLSPSADLGLRLLDLHKALFTTRENRDVSAATQSLSVASDARSLEPGQPTITAMKMDRREG
ncbi:helix-turn-helix domain-containing protein [Burkholderia cenocepacia]|uniref:helix-turn-helix domain-containing protein n=1 Tax=Burkholderia cenocepacia TaxID=95486 RepID=UPI000F580293|nr:helix-turn-helix domain-containing protein [Burkholderia cenocepacia]RQU97784.1 XRE family transcriptional regulator [Burkholderia cenocepacia]